MASIRTTQQFVEVISGGISNTIRVTQQFVEVIYASPLIPLIRLSDQYAEAITSGQPVIRLSDQYAEVITSGQPVIRLSDQYAEVIVNYIPKKSGASSLMIGL